MLQSCASSKNVEPQRERIYIEPSPTAEKESVDTTESTSSFEDELIALDKALNEKSETETDTVLIAAEEQPIDERAEFEEEKAMLIDELARQKRALRFEEDLLNLRVQELDAREERISMKEQDLTAWEEQLAAQERYLIKQAELIESRGGVISTTVPSTTTQSTSDNPRTDSPIITLPYRTIQFIAAEPGRAYLDLADLGTLVTQQIPGKDLVRYKIGGNFSDGDVQRIIKALGDRGYSGAFEN